MPRKIVLVIARDITKKLSHATVEFYTLLSAGLPNGAMLE